jgi:tetratricopeptide (TPR) repeat protein
VLGRGPRYAGFLKTRPGQIAICLAALLSCRSVPRDETALDEARNLGKAFYENPTTSAEAVAQFKKALDLDPGSNRERLNYALALLRAGQTDDAIARLKDVQKRDPKLPHTWFNLGIYYRKSGNDAAAIAQFQQMIRLTPQEPIAHYQLGALYAQTGKMPEAIAQFEEAAKLDPQMQAPHFQLYNLYRRTARAADAAREIEMAQTLRKQQENSALKEDVDWSSYAEIYDPPRPEPAASASAPTFEDIALPASRAATGLAAIDLEGTGHTDLLVWSAAGIEIYKRGRDLAADTGLAGIGDVLYVAPGDFDNDGLADLCVLTPAGPALYRNTGGRFSKVPAAFPGRRFDRAVWIDYDHDNDLDLILLGDSPALFRNQGTAAFADRTGDFPFAAGHPRDDYKLRFVPDTKAFDLAVFYSDRAPVLYRDRLGGHYEATAFSGAPPGSTKIEADFDEDGRKDAARIAPDGSVHLMRNTSAGSAHWMRVQLSGVKSVKLAEDAEVEIKAGGLYRKQTYEGVPLLFDLGAHATADVVRITWPNGLIQNETRQAADKPYIYKEANRLSGSCPMIWTWNGREFEFITDVLGVAPLGASNGEANNESGGYFPVDHREYVSIPGRALKERDGFYDVRITEELSEVSYLDQVRLYAVDHAAGSEIFTSEKFKSPPYPAFRLYEVNRRIAPQAAHDDAGRDVLPLVREADNRYPDGFARSPAGVAAMHWIELDFGSAAPTGRAVLFLKGWVDWPDGSTFRAASQELGAGLEMPSLAMQDANGVWRTVDSDMGMPAGKPKTIAVELHFISASRKLRIATNLCVYWDQIFLSENQEAPRVIERSAAPASAELGFRGFSAAHIDPARRQPDTYSYAPVSASSFWNPTPGMYTRYGGVGELVRDVDDRMVIMGSGDQLSLRFSAGEFPKPAPGQVRDYLLKVDGWAKDRDPNTAYSDSVEPLPFHAMSRYPYTSGEHYPEDRPHRQYARDYNTRPALRLIRPLVSP